MIIEKAELAKRIDKLKSVVPKSDNKPALMGILIQNGYLIASNGEMTIKAKLEGIDDESFIIPAKAFDLIRNLPDGEASITEDENNIITIKTGKIKNSYQSFPAADFMYSKEQTTQNNNSMKINSKSLKESMAHVLYAIPSKSPNVIMTALCMDASEGKLNFVGLDGHVLAWDQQDFNGEFQLLLPKGAVEKLISLDIGEETIIEYDNHAVVFISEEYELHTRLIAGKYYEYKKIFIEQPLLTCVNREEILNAITRAKLCTDEMTPTKFEIEGDSLKLSIKDKTADYSETIQLQKDMDKLIIAFNSRLVLETLKAFSSENISLSFGGNKSPMIVKDDDSEMRAVVLPVQISGGIG